MMTICHLQSIPLKTRLTKPKTKGFKADSVEKVPRVARLPLFGKSPTLNWTNSLILLFFTSIRKEFLVDISVSKGLIHSRIFALAGDGTPVVTHRERKTYLQMQREWHPDCKCDRYFSQPDCDIGWDSSPDCYYHGFDLHTLSCDSQSDFYQYFPHFGCTSKT